jgi:hypothetical protein
MATNFNIGEAQIVAPLHPEGSSRRDAEPQLARTSTPRVLSSIQSLRPKVSQSDALRKFTAAGPAGLLRALRLGPLQRIAQVYVPFYLYRVDYDLGREHQARLFAIDVVDGSLDLFEFPAAPKPADLSQVETRNALPTNLTDDAAQELLREKVLRVIFQQGFFKLRDAQMTFRREPLDLHLSYWLAFHGKENVRCRVLDATRNKIEGAKASALFESWLSA